MKNAHDLPAGTTYSVGTQSFRVVSKKSTPQQAGVPKEFVKDAKNGSMIVYNGQKYHQGLHVVRIPEAPGT